MARPDPLPELGCACANLRRAARLVTQLYSREMGSGIEPTQFALLAVLRRRPGTSQSVLGRDLGLDKTTMSRNLRVMRRNGWIEPAAAKTSGDQRERGYLLTDDGEKVLAETEPGWAQAQTRLRAALEPGDWDKALEVLGRIAEGARTALSAQHAAI
jgi:DNA-binding MarR family transcriptional regulator